MDIEYLRKQIDAIDENIVSLLKQRVSYAKKIGEIKKEKNLPIYVPEREKAIFEKLEKIAEELPPRLLKTIFREIISYSRSLEYPLKVSYLGPAGSYTHQAALQYFGSSVEELACNTIQDVFIEVEKGKCDVGVIPIENSYNGVVFQSLDCLMDFDLKIIGEIDLRIRHSLLSLENEWKNIKRIYAHPQSLEQCRIFLESNFMGVEKIQTASNSQAALIASKEKESAAIASLLCAELYGLKPLATSIEDAPDNYTRFIVLGKEIKGPFQENKTSLLISIADKPGALYEIIRAFAVRKINLSKIESRPSKRKAWDYIFFIDLEGHIKEEKVKSAIEEIKERSLFVKILGSYAKGEAHE